MRIRWYSVTQCYSFWQRGEQNLKKQAGDKVPNLGEAMVKF